MAIVVLYHIGLQFFGNRQSFFICLAAIINIWFWVDCRRCRPEMFYTALALLFLWLLIFYFRTGQALIAFLAGITAALASLTHPNGLIIVAAINISWIIWKEKPHLSRFVIWALAGFVLTILPYVIYALWATAQPNVNFFKQVMVGRLCDSVVTGEMTRWRNFLQLPLGIPLGLVMFAAWLAAWWKSAREDKFAATVIIVYVLALPFLSINHFPDYLVFTIPFFSVLIIRLIYRLHEFASFQNSRKLYYTIAAGIVLVYVFSSLLPILLMLYTQHNADFNNVVNEVAKVVGPKARIHADPVFWVGHDRYIYGPYVIAYDPLALQDAMQWAYSQSFDYVIRTSWDGGRPPQGLRSVPDNIPRFRSSLVGDNLCRLFGTKVYGFYSKNYGPVEIYKLDWSTAGKYNLKKRYIK
jgi:4-amino-4-deoxy-L-arabinose transferase-like glycosyltransferase